MKPSGGEPTTFCLACGYALRGLPEHRCPECGQTFDPDDPATYRGPKPRTEAVTLVVVYLIPFLAGVLFCTLIGAGNESASTARSDSP